MISTHLMSQACQTRHPLHQLVLVAQPEAGVNSRSRGMFGLFGFCCDKVPDGPSSHRKQDEDKSPLFGGAEWAWHRPDLGEIRIDLCRVRTRRVAPRPRCPATTKWIAVPLTMTSLSSLSTARVQVVLPCVTRETTSTASCVIAE